jgi:SAM-dependent methyltransferase
MCRVEFGRLSLIRKVSGDGTRYLHAVVSPILNRSTSAGRWGGLSRSIALFEAFRLEQSDPDRFYQLQAADTVAQLERDLSFDGALVLDLGGGAGYFSQAMAARGAEVFLVEPEAGEPAPNRLVEEGGELTQEERHRLAVWPGRLNKRRTVAGDGYRLPFADATFDLVFSSNVLEHVADPERFLRESIRVAKPGGHVYVSSTVWFSPWGGHETSPWHLFGGHFAARRYERIHGKPPGNLYGSSMFRCDVGQVLRLVKEFDEVGVVREEPRYYPSWMRWIIRVPVLRELLTWNLAVTLKVGGGTH